MELAEQFKYEYHSHQFDPAVLASYNNLVKYQWIQNADYLSIKQQKKKTIIL